MAVEFLVLSFVMYLVVQVDNLQPTRQLSQDARTALKWSGLTLALLSIATAVAEVFRYLT